jgi:hypothetical protein
MDVEGVNLQQDSFERLMGKGRGMTFLRCLPWKIGEMGWIDR